MKDSIRRQMSSAKSALPFRRRSICRYWPSKSSSAVIKSTFWSKVSYIEKGKVAKVSDIDQWLESQEFQITLDAEGKIIDFLDETKSRPNTPEERIRQKMGQILHYEFNYPKNCMAFEKHINIGREKKRADIVVYSSSTARANEDQGQIVLIGEAKAPTERVNDGQLTSYISASSAQGGFWTNGDSIEFFRRNRDTGIVYDWIGIPKCGQAWDAVGRYHKSELIQPVDLKLAFRRCHNAMYRQGIDSEDVALDMTRVILAKIEDESSSKEECDFHITPEEFSDPAARDLACARVRALFETVRDRYPDVFSPTEKITSSDSQLAIVISQLQQYAFLEATHDVIGTAYETYVASSLKGERGQYFTNRLVVNMMVRMLNPSDKDIVLDPCCGSGGFILTAMNYIFNHIDESPRRADVKEILKRNVVHSLFGVDISPKLVKIAKANMLLAKDGHGGIEHANSLDEVESLSASFNEKCGRGKPTMILTNPPFGSGHDLRIKDPQILRHYQVGRQWAVDDSGNIEYSDSLNTNAGVAPEVLFLEKCLSWLKPDGVLGIVMAKGQLDNREAYALRHHVLKNAQLLAVVNLHEDTFEPFCGSKASVIFLRKTDAPPENYPIFMALSNKVGQTSRGKAILKKNAFGKPIVENGMHILDEDLSEIAEAYEQFKRGKLEESESRFSIQRSQLDPDGLSFNPVHYLPQYNMDYAKVMMLGESDNFEIHRLGDIAQVYNGPRFKRPYAEPGVTEGDGIVPYFTGTALTQLRGENVKYLDRKRATSTQNKQLDELTIHKGYILISDAGTLGRVTYALSKHDGVVATNNLIRVVTQDVAMRGYLYEFLRSSLGQSLILKNSYGTNQEHLEPDVIAEVPIPVPKNREVLEQIGLKIISSIETLELSMIEEDEADRVFCDLLRI